MQKIAWVSISGRLTLDMHSLNNEGGEGNQIMTRTVNIIYDEGKDGQKVEELASVNAISGDMFKHIQGEHLHNIAKEEGLPLCAGCANAHPNRIGVDSEFVSQAKGKPDGQVTEAMLKRCAVDDLEGILITSGNRNTARKSVVEFGWVVGLPDKTRTDSYFHVKYVADPGAKGKSDEEEAANVGQAIFHRPASSGVYAAVVSMEAARIGFNDYQRVYAVDPAERKRRYSALLRSVAYTFVQPNGAMRNTQNPHILGFEGVVAVSHTTVPAPLVSSLSAGYEDEMKRIRDAVNRIEGGTPVETWKFESLSEFMAIIGDLVSETEPLELK